LRRRALRHSLLLYGFLAWQYLVGSGLAFMGGVFNYWRAYLVIKRQLSAQISS